MRTLVMFVSLAPLLGCGGGPCADRSGMWRQNLTARSGTCADKIETVGMYSQADQMPEGCTGSGTISQDNCVETVDVTCPTEGGGSVRLAGQVTYDSASNSGSGILDMTVRDSFGPTCQGTYDATYTKL